MNKHDGYKDNCVYPFVMPHQKRRQWNNKTTERMRINANASAKSKEAQRLPQADTQLHHICFCPDTRTE